MVFGCSASKSKYFLDCIGITILSYAIGRKKYLASFPAVLFLVRDEAVARALASDQFDLSGNSRGDAMHVWVYHGQACFKGILLVFSRRYKVIVT